MKDYKNCVKILDIVGNWHRSPDRWRGGGAGRGVAPFPGNFEVLRIKRESFLPVWRVCYDRTHTANDDYHLLKLKMKNGENHSPFFFYSSRPLPFFP